MTEHWARMGADSVVGFRFQYEPGARKLSMADLQAELAQLEDLLDLVRYSLAPNIRTRNLSSGAAPSSGRSMPHGGRQYQVEHLSFNSPLELVIAIPGVIGATTFTGAKLIKLWRDFNDARVVHAKAGMQVELKNAQQEAIRFMRENMAEAMTRASDRKALSAARALLSLDDVQVIKEPEA